MVNNNRTTQIILAAIALGLFVNALTPLLRPAPVAAADSFSCSGKLKANAWGGTTANIGGYEVELDCR